MSNLFKFFIPLFAFFASINVIAQETAEQKMCKDYPKLMDKYGSCIESQHAHYIFAIDVSTSMAAYESTVKENLCTFVNAVPDGDQISLIRVADTDRTGFVNNFQSITISSDTKSALKDAIYSDDFRFNQDGSDMFTMADLIIKSINTPGSRNLVFIYMFTDFEYWTSKNKYAKPEQASWDALKNSISASNKRLVKHGLELNHKNPNLRQHAIVKEELSDIFGKVEYQGAKYASVLRDWFTNQIAEIMAEKLNSLVEQDWDAFVDSVVCDVEKQGNSIVANVKYSPVDLVSGLTLTAESEDSYFIPQPATAELKDNGSSTLTLGRYNVEPNSWLPQYTVRGGGNNFNILVNIESPYKEEINRLQQVCRDYTKCQESKKFQLEPPTIRLWDSHIPLWIWIVVAVILLIIIVSILYQFLAIKLDYSWQVVVMGYDAESNRIERTTLEILARDRENNVIKSKTTNTWVIRVVGKRYNPLLIFKKSGYYITLEQGGFLEIMDPYAPKEAMHTLQVGDEVFVSSYRKPNEVNMQIKADGNKYKIVMN